ncbi:MAG: isopentenyl-diphosphate Delta-isomerase [Bacteroidales bacterium]|nr:isopentenyl-diphosphate Delta-isomerase [Bacteroidales bacterium]HPD96301.1 isopentenyl-diphosphate Delta-isomerase [Tenuifilaceae bacterium]
MEELITLVDENDREVGYAEKLAVHQKGLLHRAFSVLVFNSKGEMLIHKRALSKYHSPGLWTNACCSHLPKGETMKEAIHSRLTFEMGIDCDLQLAFTFHYKVEFEQGLTENELDWVFFGLSDSVPKPNSDEVDSWRYMNVSELSTDIRLNPKNYTYWFKHIMTSYFSQIDSFVKSLNG